MLKRTLLDSSDHEHLNVTDLAAIDPIDKDIDIDIGYRKNDTTNRHFFPFLPMLTFDLEVILRSEVYVLCMHSCSWS